MVKGVQRFGIAGAVAAAALPWPVQAQTAPVPTRAEGAFSPSQHVRRLEVDVSGLILYDDNIARSSEALARARGIEQEDVRFSPAVNVNAAVPVGRHLFFFRGTAGYDFHLRNTFLNRERLEARMGMTFNAARCSATVEGLLARRQTQLEDIDLGPIDNAETIKEATLSGSCPRAVGLVPSFQLQAREVDNSAPARRTTDYNSRSAQGGLTYVQPSIGELGVFVGYFEAEYPNRIVASPEGPQEDRIEATNIGATYRRAVGSLLHLGLRIAHTDVDTRSDDAAFSGLTYGVLAQVNPLGRLRADLSADRSIQPSNRLGVNYILDELYRGELIYTLNPKTAFRLGAAFRERSYNFSQVLPGIQLTEEDTRTIFGAVEYKVGPRISFRLEAQSEERNTNNPLFDYTSNRIGLSTRLSL